MKRIFSRALRRATACARSTTTRRSCSPPCARWRPRGRGDPRVVLLTPGTLQLRLLRALRSWPARWGSRSSRRAISSCHDDRVFMRTTRGLQRGRRHLPPRRRRLPRPARPSARDSMLGVPGLLNAYRAGNVTLANAIGTGVADDKAIYAVRAGDDPLLPRRGADPRSNVPTYLGCRRATTARYMLEHLDELVVKAVDQSRRLRDADRPALDRGASATSSARRIQAEPRNYIAQPTIALSRHPTFVDGELRGLPRRPAPVRASRGADRDPHRARRPHAHRAPARLARRQLVAGRRQQGHLGARRTADARMLSRVAESLYWTARYVERAEDVDAPASTSTSTRSSTRRSRIAAQAWRQIVAAARRRRALPRSTSTSATASQRERLGALARRQPERRRRLHHARARERALGARADLGRDVGGDQQAVPARARREPPRRLRASSHAFFEQLRNGAHLFQGAADATMTHGEPYEFIRLGLHLERAATTVRDASRRATRSRSRARRGRPGASPAADRLLESCSAFEAYVRSATATPFEPRRDRRRADPLAPTSARGAATASQQPRRRLDGSRSDQGRRTGSLGRLVRRARRTARSTTYRGESVTQTLRRAARRGSTRPASAIDEAYFSSRARPAPARSRRRSAAAAMWLTRRAHDPLRVRRARSTRRTRELRLQARSPVTVSAARRSRSRRSRAACRRSPSTATASATRSTTSTCSSRITTLVVTARSEVWTPERVRRRRGGAVAARPLGSASRDTRYVPLDGAIGGARGRRSTRRRDDSQTAHALMTPVRGRMTLRDAARPNVQTLADEALAAQARASARTSPTCMIGVCRAAAASRRATSAATSTTRARSGSGDAASHAWVDVFDAERGWVSLDPTHDREQTEALRPRRRRPRLRRRPADAGRLQGKATEDARGRRADPRV